MECKTFEIRDRMTFIPALAVRLEPACEADRYLLSRAGYGTQPHQQAQYVQLIRIAGGKGEGCCDPYDWGSRTFGTAHQYIIDNWESLKTGAVIDVQFILGETTQPAQSEAVEAESYLPPKPSAL